MPAAYTWSSTDPSLSAAALDHPSQHHLDVDRLFELLRRFGRHGALSGGGITRLAASEADGAARREFVELLQAAGATTGVDSVGNVHGRFELAGPDAPWILCGSHLDSQPGAGELDGTYGVLAGLCVAEALMRARRAGVRFAANLCVVDWCNEEGARFRPSMLGSAVHVGKLQAAEALASTDDEGVQLGDALERIGFRGDCAPPADVRAYLELHIEQGPVLDWARERLGVVTRHWGAIKHKLVYVGAQAHTGPTPMAERRDALLAASRVVVALRQLADDLAGPGAPLHTSVGRLLIEPNSPNTVAARTELSVELRSPDPITLARADAALQEIAAEAARRAQVELLTTPAEVRPARPLSQRATGWVRNAATRLGQQLRSMDTVAGHDALNFVGRCDVGLIFVPSIGGISHHPDETTAPADLALGLRALADVLWTACHEPPPLA